MMLYQCLGDATGGASWEADQGAQAAQPISRSSLPWALEIGCGSLPGGLPAL